MVGHVEPFAPEDREVDRERLRAMDRVHGDSGEEAAPLVERASPVVIQPFDVATSIRCQDDADGGNEPGGDPAPSENDMDQGSADAAVAVRESVDRLELRMGDGCLDDRRHVGPVEILDQVVEQRRGPCLLAAG